MKLAKELLRKPELPKMFGKEFTGHSSPGQGGQLDTESSQAVNQAAGFSSSRFSSYQNKQHSCIHTILLSLSSSSSSLVLSSTPHLQMPAKLLLPWLGASSATRQPSQTQLPACSEKPAQLSAFQSAGLAPQHFHSLTTLLASPGQVAHEMETVTAH